MTAETRNVTLAVVVGGAVLWAVSGSVSGYLASVILLTLLYAYAAASWSFVLGWMGVFSLGHTIFIAAGGYTSTVLWTEFGVSPWIGMLVGALVAVLLSIPIGLAALRRRVSGLYAALITLIVAQAALPVVANIRALGGAVGLYLPVEQGSAPAAMQFASAAPFIRILILLNVGIVILLTVLRTGRFGYRVRALHDDELAAEATGVPVTRYKLAAFALSAALAAPMGTILAQYQLFATPDSLLSINLLITIVIVGLVGGVERSWGSLLGAAVVVPLTQEIASRTGNRPGAGTLVFAVGLLLIAVALPKGISGALTSARKSHGRPGDDSPGEPQPSNDSVVEQVPG